MSQYIKNNQNDFIFKKLVELNNSLNNKYSDFFIETMNLLLKHEGIYSNYKNDNGGETVFGIARHYFPQYNFWNLIDEIKDENNFNEKFLSIDENDPDYYYKLKNLFKEFSNVIINDQRFLMILEGVLDFYYNLYWKKSGYSMILNIDPNDEDLKNIVKKLFTLSVNQGTYKTGNKYLQQSLNLLNVNGKKFPDLVVDGLVGKKTIDALKILKKENFLETVYNLIRYFQCDKYVKLMQENPTKYKIFRGWFRRV